ncbi:hypothetical protein ASE11_02185 [Hydrogenophaga sp. Root209]|uniref:hypothetical protein n=1 Tax=Hydrogenophaga sp. Root209 TaxID=1736490 RepID=UPI0006F47DF2|nr:hypothetical protein [Hydrogenophaga sp. Root209]KRC12289.1 hypothetical protein ASE11_02185 [Hydrogenophaga sp. Root209]
MTRLDTEQQRLYPDAADGHTRALVLGLARPADWTLLRAVWQGVQADLELPAPAIAVSGTDSYQLWFSLAQPVALEQAQRFLEQLRQRYLPDVARSRILMWPPSDVAVAGSVHRAPAVPALQEATGNWSAFVSPDLPAVFGEDPWLDMAPGQDAQAELLSRLKCIQPDEWTHALERLIPAKVPGAPPTRAPTQTTPPAPTGDAPMEPRQFLMSVMNDASAPLALRIEAAKALLSQTPRGSA